MKINHFHGARHLCVILLLLLSQAAASRADTRTTGQFLVFGTLVEVTVSAPDKARSTQAINALEKLYRDLHRRLHPWLPGPLADLNEALSQGKTMATEPVIIDLIKRSQGLSKQSGGRFDPAIGRLVELWGFHRPAAQWQPPARQQIEELVAAHPTITSLQIRGAHISSDNPDMQLDFGGIAKGYAVDAGLDLLREHGIEAAMINAGGDLGVIGRATEERHWRAAIKKPGSNDTLATLALFDGEFLATSGNYERFHRFEGKQYTHLIDPRTGWPETAWASVTVLSRDGALADAAATALSIATVDNWQHVAKSMGIDKIILVNTASQIFLTPSIRKRLQFQ